MSSIFLSHSSRDREIAVRLARDLENHDHTVWLDEWRIQIGDSIVSSIQHGLENSEFLVLLLSCHAVESSWVEREWSAAYWKEVNEKLVRLLPVLLEPCRLPALLSGKKYAVLFPKYGDGLRQLLNSVEAHRMERIDRDFCAGIDKAWAEERAASKGFRDFRNQHWDDWGEYLASLSAEERALTQKLNTLYYLEKYHLKLGQLKRQLGLFGLFKGPDSDEYTSEVALGLQEFQRRYSLRHIDGVFGPLTYLRMAEVLRLRLAGTREPR